MTPAALGRRLWAHPYGLLTLTPLIWAGNAVAARVLAGEVSPMATTCLRWLLATLLLVAFAGRRILRERALLRRHWLSIFGLGALGYTGFNAPLYLAGETTTAVNIGMIQGIMPAMMMAGSMLAYGTPIARTQVAGLVLGLAGILLIVSRGDIDVLRHLEIRPGDLLIVLACILYAGYTVALRARPPIPPIPFFAGLCLAAFVSSAPLMGWEMATGRIVWPGPEGWLILLLLAIFPSLVSQMFFMRGVELIGPARAGLFINLVPVFAALLGVGLLGETFAPYHAVALVMVLGGIWMAERAKPEG